MESPDHHDAIAGKHGNFSYHRGTNQSGMRAYNERLVLSLVHQNGALAKAEIAGMTGLSAQTISVIMRSLEADRLLVRGEPVRGKVGQPSIPLSLNPDGAYFFGLKIGRRSAELILIDFKGKLRNSIRLTYAYPTPASLLSFLNVNLDKIHTDMGTEKYSRIAGLGIATPYELWNWTDEMGAPIEEMDIWRDYDIQAQTSNLVDYPVYLQNDATAACGAQLAFGTSEHKQDFIYFHIGSFVGGGVVINGNLHSGPSGNAGALGSMPVPLSNGKNGQLIDLASLVVLEKMLADLNIDTTALWNAGCEWPDFGDILEIWIDQAAKGLAFAIVAASAVIDFQSVSIDGALPREVLAKIIDATSVQIANFDLQGIVPPSIVQGSLGPNARALGGASLPLFEKYLINQNALLLNS